MKAGANRIALAATLVLALGLVAGIDATIRASREQWRAHRLAVVATADLARLEEQLASVADSVALLGAVHQLPTQLPTLQQIEDLAWEYGLDTRRVERVAPSKAATTPAYTVLLVGTVFEAVPFVKELEDTFALRLSQVGLQRASASGEQILLSLTAEVAP